MHLDESLGESFRLKAEIDVKRLPTSKSLAGTIGRKAMTVCAKLFASFNMAFAQTRTP
jgi:hypothetical protein